MNSGAVLGALLAECSPSHDLGLDTPANTNNCFTYEFENIYKTDQYCGIGSSRQKGVKGCKVWN